DEHSTHGVPVLAGAFFWSPRRILDEVGLLDEAFFMYGEDIDLSYRISQAGYQNYYFPTTTIIHYKGESTKRGSLNYVRTFYQAMIIFARKHFQGGALRSLVGLMKVAIYFRAALTLLGNGWQRLQLPLLDGAGIYLGLLLLKNAWSTYHFNDLYYYPDYILWLHFPAYTLMWLLGIFLSGGYDRPFELERLLRGLGISTLLLTTIYGLLPMALRPSRALLLLGAAWALAFIVGVRLLLHALRFGHLRLAAAGRQRLLIVGSATESERVLQLLQKAGVYRNYLGRVSPQEPENDSIGVADQLTTLAQVYRAEELIFCSADLSVAQIHSWMTTLGPQRYYKIMPQGSNSIIGSHYADRQGTLYTIDLNWQIADPTQRRNKWMLDKLASALLLMAAPILILRINNRLGFLANLWRVGSGQSSWVGYDRSDQQLNSLPQLKPGVLGPAPGNTSGLDAVSIHHLNFLYARDYRPSDDLRLLWAQWQQLGRQH
ncbi:MAG: glycosyltransferase, partial [Lewinella sp.]|nr:glycosyltransferase [Lewinella sp.]